MNRSYVLRLVLAQVCVHSAMTGSRLAAPLLALHLGYNAAAVGGMLALYALAPVFLALPVGRLADRHGLRLPLMLAVGTAMLGARLAALWPTFIGLCLAAPLLGTAANTAQITLQRHVGQLAADANERKLAFSWMGSAPALAHAPGPLAAGLLIDHGGAGVDGLASYRAAFLVLALLPLGCAWLLRHASDAAADPETAGGRRAVRDLLRLPLVQRLLFANWLQSMAWDAHTFVLPLLGYERGMDASSIGGLMGAFAIAAALVRMALPWLARHGSEWQVIHRATLLAATALLAYPWMPGVVGMGLCSMIVGMALGSVQPMVLSLLHDAAPPARQGEAMALRSLTMNSSSLAMPVLLGAMGVVAGAAGLLWLVGGVLALGSRASAGRAGRAARPG